MKVVSSEATAREPCAGSRDLARNQLDWPQLSKHQSIFLKAEFTHDEMVPLRYRHVMAMQLRLSPDEDRMLNELAEEGATSKNQLIATLVREAWERKRARNYTFALLDQISEERSDLLDRLAQ